MKISKIILLLITILSPALTFADAKPKLTLDDFFNSVDFRSVVLSPDGNSVVIETERADWDQKIFRTDLWLYRDDAKSLIQLTQSGHDTDPQWSPDGRWIAFLSERKSSSEKDSDSDDKGPSSKKSKDDKGETAQLYVISPTGGEAIALTTGEEEVHTYSWSADSHTIYFATRQPWPKSQKDDYKKQWKDVEQYRTAERGDSLFALDLPAALARHMAAPASMNKESDKDKTGTEHPDLTPGTREIANFRLRIDNLVTSPDGSQLAFISNAVNQRQEKSEDIEIYVCGVGPTGSMVRDKQLAATPQQLTQNQAVETRLHWANDSRHIFFTVEIGDVSGSYRDLQPHLYWIETETKKIDQWGKDFLGSVDYYSVASDTILIAARLGTEVATYSASQPSDSFHKLSVWPGTYEKLSTKIHSSRIAFVYSSLQKPGEIYLAESVDRLDQARPITSFNKLLAGMDLPQGKPYLWKADDGTSIEGMLIYPPGKFEQKNLPLFTFIHGGPADADGNHFEADWYQWSALAATNGWLVFQPNYRGSTGYGDKFLQQIVPQLVSRPGKDILEGVDALVKDGIADPAHLAIGGYSYGGYMTNWLITQTTRFKAAVTGAGAVEHIANWGNDDTTMDDAYFLGGRPWEAPQRYHDEAAIFQIDKVKTPTHIVAGADDIRVAVLEQYLLEHALYSLGIPNKLLIFPGEGHGLGKNPWHGKIKVREELLWLQKYAVVP